MQQVLILNAGSSSLKWLVLEAGSETVRQEGDASWVGAEQGRHEREILLRDGLPGRSLCRSA